MRPKTHTDLPPRMLRRVRTLKSGKLWQAYYYNGRDEDGGRIEIPLGRDLAVANRKWAELEGTPSTAVSVLMRDIFDRYLREIIPKKAPRTQQDDTKNMRILRRVFDAVHIDTITPQHIAQYRDRRGQKAPVRANREIALLSHVFNIAREWGCTAHENPCRGVRKNKEKPRENYVDDEVWEAVHRHACPELQDALDLAYLTGQRPADVLKLRWSDIRDGALEVQQNKTTKKLRIVIEDDTEHVSELSLLLDRIRARRVTSLYLIATASGMRLSQTMRRKRFDRARDAAAVEAKKTGNADLSARIRAFQLRDIRSKTASDLPVAHASQLLGHTEQAITERVYRRRGETVRPAR